MTTDTATLASFLLARIAEDEAHPEAHLPAWIGGERVPNRWMREAEAKRRIVEIHANGWDTGWIDPDDPDDPEAYSYCKVCDDGTGTDGQEHWPCATLRALALPYADHSSFREEWRA